MLNKVIDQAIERIPGLDDTALSLSHGIHAVVLRGGWPARTAADVLHGKGLGHPLHPALTDFAVGGWVLGIMFDLIWLRTRSRTARQAADTSILFGTLSALPTTLSGIADYSTIPKASAGTGLLHALFNVINMVLFGVSLLLRKNRQRDIAVVLSLTAASTLGFAAMLGGHLSYSQRVGTNHDKPVDAMPDWTTVEDLDALTEGLPKQVDVQNHPILLYRKGNAVLAVSSTCSHAGGALAEGKFTDCTVECPLHQSVFDLRNGNIIHGPATQAITNYETRIQHGQVQVRLLYSTK
ncbi:MAG: Rieske 2Fe-2S domain-containing protein [Chloroflexi bacterium]|nr:Rieske 2Fe-2S domain-containing protein [Chloroflexota bacterium]